MYSQKTSVVSCDLNVMLSLPFSDKVIRHRASSLKDTAHAIFAAELDPEFDRMCEDIKEARRKKGKESQKHGNTLPKYVHCCKG